MQATELASAKSLLIRIVYYKYEPRTEESKVKRKGYQANGMCGNSDNRHNGL